MPSTAKFGPLVTAALVVALTSCSIIPEQAPNSPLPPPPPPNAVVGEPVVAMDPAGIAGALPTSLHTGTTTPVSARWNYIDGAENFNNRLDSVLLGIFDQNAGGRYDPSIADPAATAVAANTLTLDQEIIAIGDAMVGTRTTQSQVAGGSVPTASVTTEYTDLSTGTVQPGAALLAPDSFEKVRQFLGEAVETEPQASTPPASPEPSSSAVASSPPVPVPPPAEALLGGAAFSPNGDLVVPLAISPSSGSPLAAPLTVHISAKSSTGLLSELGQRIQQLATVPRPLIPLEPAPAGQKHVNCDLVPCAALTYDDGPNDQTTRLLGILASHNVHATFFEQGNYVAARPEITAAVAAAGHVLGNHTMRHPDLTKLSAAAVQAEVQGTTNLINNAAGVLPGFLRPPYGASNAQVNSIVGMPIIDWSVDSLDWQSRNKEVFLPKILNLVKPGAVILQHDIHPTTVDGQDQLITSLQGLGYHLVTVPQLFRGIELKNGRAYFCRGTTSPCTPGR